MELPARHLILYDGVCALCNASVQRVIDGDRDGHFCFAPLQGITSAACSERLGRSFGDDLNRVVLIADHGTEDERVLERSRAVFFILQRIRSPWRRLAFLRHLPTPLLDLGYRMVACVRYRLFGRQTSCRLPTKELRARLLD